MSKESDLIGVGCAPEHARIIANQSVKSNVSAAGTAITDATDLAHEFNVVSTVGASAGVQLPNWPLGASVEVVNTGANSLSIYPHSSTGTINGGSAGAAQALANSGKHGRFTRVSATDWRYVLFN